MSQTQLLRSQQHWFCRGFDVAAGLLPVCLSVCLPVCLSVCFSVCLSACPENDVVTSTSGCTFDEDCLRDEVCEESVCVKGAQNNNTGNNSDDDAGSNQNGNGSGLGQIEIDGGSIQTPEQDEDAGITDNDAGSPLDAGIVRGTRSDTGFLDAVTLLGCPREAEQGLSAAAPLVADAAQIGRDPLVGAMCPAQPMFYQFSASNGQTATALLAWRGTADLDLLYKSPSQLDFLRVGPSVASRWEAISGLIGEDGAHLLDVEPFVAEESSRAFAIVVRSGAPCQTDVSCQNQGFPASCIMPVWGAASNDDNTAALAQTPPPEALVTLSGSCAPPWPACPAADDLFGSGESRTLALPESVLDIMTESNQSLWGCMFDEDWYQIERAVGDSVTVIVNNHSGIPLSALIGVYDVQGNLLAGTIMNDAVAFTPQVIASLSVPSQNSVGGRSILFVRYLQLNDDDAGAYQLLLN